MATKQNLMAYGMSSPLARRMGYTPKLFTASGASQASAPGIGGDSYLTVINATNSGSGVQMPQVGGQVAATSGALLGDSFYIWNLLTASICIYAANNSLGSAVTFYGNGVSAAGTTGISVPTGQSVQIMPVTISTYVYLKSVVSA